MPTGDPVCPTCGLMGWHDFQDFQECLEEATRVKLIKAFAFTSPLSDEDIQRIWDIGRGFARESEASVALDKGEDGTKVGEPEEEEELDAVWQEAMQKSGTGIHAGNRSKAFDELRRMVVRERRRAKTLASKLRIAFDNNVSYIEERDEARDTICKMLYALGASQMSAASPQTCVQTCENIRAEVERKDKRIELLDLLLREALDMMSDERMEEVIKIRNRIEREAFPEGDK